MPSKIFKLSDVLPNPFRNLDRLPLSQEKVAHLMKSIEETGYWENVVGRITEDNRFQIAYGHHRLEAAKRVLGETAERSFIVMDLDDTAMLQIMTRENDDVYRSDLRAVVEDVRSTIQAFAEGRTKLSPVVPGSSVKNSYIRYAPSFVVGRQWSKSDHCAYTELTLASFLGKTKKNGEHLRAYDSVVAALAYLENEELGITGWNAKALDTFRKPDGSIPVNTVLTAAKSAQTRQQVVMAREKEKATVVKEQGRALQQELAAVEAERKRIAEEEEKEAKRRAKELTEKEAARKAQEKDEREQRKKDAEERAAALAREWEANKAERAKQKKAEEQRKAKAAQDVENSRIARVRTLIEKVDRILAEDSLFEELKKPPVMNPAECKILKKALTNLGTRADKAANKL